MENTQTIIAIAGLIISVFALITFICIVLIAGRLKMILRLLLDNLEVSRMQPIKSVIDEKEEKRKQLEIIKEKLSKQIEELQK